MIIQKHHFQKSIGIIAASSLRFLRLRPLNRKHWKKLVADKNAYAIQAAHRIGWKPAYPIGQVYDSGVNRKKSKRKAEDYPKNLLAGQYPLTGPEKRQFMHQKTEQYTNPNIKQSKKRKARKEK